MKTVEEAWKEIEELAADDLNFAICLMDIQERLKDTCNNVDRSYLKTKVHDCIVRMTSGGFLLVSVRKIIELLKEVEAAL